MNAMLIERKSHTKFVLTTELERKIQYRVKITNKKMSLTEYNNRVKSPSTY